ncbi:hypothetical protein SLS56_010163 [Neofusicoccum ribis]|uniref:DUF6590 domain-containing protein n=1 Tax=Neofusicoccum ribis TaxID=45134 RepID=A0ABR3SF81_9PEZI
MANAVRQIKTYENKATTRPDVRNKQHEHAIIYTGVEPPKPLKGESNLQDPIEADAESQATYLSPLARINYGESHEIQHTEKVYNLGQVTENCVSKLQRTYDLVSCRSSTPGQTAPTRKRTFDDVTEGLERTSLDNDKRPFIYNDGRASEAASFYNTPSSLGDSSGNEGSPGHHDKVRKDAVFFGPLNDGHIFGTLLDTGAECNFISKRKADKLGARVLRYQGPDIKVGNGNILRPEGILSSCWRFNDKSRTYMDQFVIMPDLPADVVIGRQAIFDRSFLLANEELLILGLKTITKPERVAQEEAAIRNAEQNLKQEVQERDAMRSNLKKEREERQAKHR